MDYRRSILITLIIVLCLGILHASIDPNSTSHASTTIDSPQLQESKIIEGTRHYILSSTEFDFADSVQSLTYGSHYTVPPSGMGANDTSYSLLQESQTTDYSWSTIQSVGNFNDCPSGWTDTSIYYPGDDYFHEASGAYFGEIYSSTVSTSSVVSVRFTINIACDYNGGDGGISIYFWDNTNTWNEVRIIGEQSEGNVVVTSSDSKYKHPNFRVKIAYGCTDLLLEMQANNWRVEKQTSDTYYAFQAVYKFTGVDSGTYPIEELYIDFSDESDADRIDIRVESGDTSPDNLVVNAAKGNLDFHIDIHNYLTSSEFYVEIRDDVRSGDSNQTNWTIERLYINLTNSEPVLDTTPLTDGLVNTEYVLADYNSITTIVNVSDADGVDQLDYVTLTIQNNAGTEDYFTVRFDQTGLAFSETTNPGNVTLNTGSCSVTSSSTSFEIVFNYTIPFDCPQITDADYYIEVHDDCAEYDTLRYEANWDAVTTLSLDGIFSLNDGVGTPDRGNPGDMLTASGTIIYTGLSLYHPLSSSIDITVACSNVSGSPWSASNYDQSDGSFSVSVPADGTIGCNRYSVTVNNSATDRLDATYEAIYITDRIICTGITSPSHIVDSTATGYMYVHLQYMFDGSNVTDGSYQLDELALELQPTDLWLAEYAPGTLTSIMYNSVTIVSNDHGIDAIDMNSKELTMYWDQLVCYISDPYQTMLDLGQNATGMLMWAEYYYSSSHGETSYTGTLEANDTVFTLFSPGEKSYRVSTAYGDDPWGIFTIFSSNATHVIWNYPDVGPSWDPDPIDQNSEFYSLFYYDINASVPSGVSKWWLNITSPFTINISNGIITNNTPLSIGTYSLKVFVNDTWGRSINASFFVFVEDTTKPWWIDAPADREWEYGTSFRYDLNASDFSGIGSWTVNTTDFKIDGNGILENNTLLTIKSYTLRVYAIDNWGLNITATFVVTIVDNTDPIWEQTPTDCEWELGVPFLYDMNASDLSGIHTWWLNISIEFQIDGDGKLTNKTTLDIGFYELRIFVNDTQSNTLSANITITILDRTNPVWRDAPVEKEIELGSSLEVQFIAFDLTQIHWSANYSTLFSINTTTGLLTNIDWLDVGKYHVNVTATDTSGNALSSVIKVIVIDETPPSFNELPVDQFIELGDSLDYDLDASDISGTVIWWISDSANFSIDTEGRITNRVPLVVGTYTLTIGISDSFENTAYSLLSVTVQDTTPPTWSTTPQDQTIFYGGHLAYQLVAHDESAITLWTVNDTRFTINIGLLEDANMLPVGTYHVNITVYDAYDNSLFIILKITVRMVQVTTTIPPEIMTLAIMAIAGTGVVSLFVLYRLKKVEKKSSAPREGKEDLSSALDYLDEIQDDINPSDEN